MPVKGFQFSAVEAAIKKPGRLDLALIFSQTPARVAAVFTTNKVKAAPVLISQQRAKDGICRAVLVNSGNANACTGEQGMRDALTCGRKTAEALGLPDEELLIASTGVIGQTLPMDRFRAGIEPLVDGLSGGTIENVADAIMTTDSFAKLETRSGAAGGVPYTITGIAKGAGMIQPNMATMLAFLVTDADVEPAFLDRAFKEAVDGSFNAITVDGDTSTNDTALIMANGAAANPLITAGTPEGERFVALLHDVLLSLAKLIVKDGEGATKFVEIRVQGAADHADAKQAALAVANSLLVKTAFFGQDANWGRIIAAVGYSGCEMDQGKVRISFDDVLMVQDGIFTGGDAEAAGTEVLKQKEFTVTIDLRIGSGAATVYTSDLTYDYVRINADYRT
ncbi:bifunctional glutamate N-acetyltransferase/amino-acid acetyltransferase ArgJ [Geomesophilobacter sediminis]|uniref:Arginine biosynthesis bifunctional protein ArgJ n=1 Tax=Geomesophilobacter sediminis TaxID=2798584 RepID=A0A8J7IQW4_9BACT|nr:bifunctional glutamate N-acetyltransferase/amino-acid acetyltransferase ArgJ [Geomesophilobacter sediminis]MBJ6725134.1 bifunctional glutamate N-acetyltransferase/amino-acid acetyltransferase ArgJ [Geomesophilobacter sediminis]